MKKVFIAASLTSLSLSVAAIFMYGIAYFGIHQYIRLNANELPQQYADAVKAKIAEGNSAADALNGIERIDMEKSASPFVIIYDNTGRVQAGTATLNGTCPTPPWGVFNTVNKKGEDHITWQPEKGVRNATIVQPYRYNGNEGYILTGRSLRDAEAKQRLVLSEIKIGMIFTPILIFTINYLIQLLRLLFSKGDTD